jgi:hypothetical protein
MPGSGIDKDNYRDPYIDARAQVISAALATAVILLVLQ